MTVKAGADYRAVIELYTSQGCSSCPPADALLAEYAKSGDVIALTMPVDYWDYLGWKDTYGSSKHSSRQRAYAAKSGDGMVYTPQVVVNGRTHVNGASRGKIEQAIGDTSTRFAAERIPVTIRIDQSDVVIEAGTRSAVPDSGEVAKPHATVWLATVLSHAAVKIRHGENKGQHLSYANVVRELVPVGMWDGKATTIRLDKRAVLANGAQTLAVIVQHDTTGPILGAALLPPPTN